MNSLIINLSWNQYICQVAESQAGMQQCTRVGHLERFRSKVDCLGLGYRNLLPTRLDQAVTEGLVVLRRPTR